MRKIILIFVLVILIASCNEAPVNYVEVPRNPPTEISYKTNLLNDRYLKDTDTLRIELLDTSLVSTFYFKNFFSFTGNIDPSIFETKNEVYEYIHLLLTIEVNPDNPYELWVFGYKANIDSTRTKKLGRYLNYTIIIGSTLDERYYIDNELDFDVVSTTE